MRTGQLMLGLAAALVLLCASPGLAGFSLSPRFVEGRETAYVMSIQALVDMKLQGASESTPATGLGVHMQLTFDVLTRVLSVDDEQVRLAMDFKNMRLNVRLPGMGDMELGADPGTVSIEIALTPDGRIKGLDDFFNSFEELLKRTPDRLRVRTPADSGDFIDLVKGAFALLYDFAGKGEAELGESWRSGRDLGVPVLGMARMEYEYSIIGVEEYAGRQCLRIGITAGQKLAEPLELGLGWVDIDKFSAPPAHGAVLFDYQAAELASFQYVQDMFILAAMRPPRSSADEPLLAAVQTKFVIDYSIAE